MIHSDIWGPIRIKNIIEARWFITFIDDHTRLCWVFLLKEKSDAKEIFQVFHKMVKIQFQAQIQILHTTNGLEYFHSIMGKYFTENGIVHQTTYVGTSQQNEIAERKNRHLLEVARALLFTNNVPSCFRG